MAGTFALLRARLWEVWNAAPATKVQSARARAKQAAALAWRAQRGADVGIELTMAAPEAPKEQRGRHCQKKADPQWPGCDLLRQTARTTSDTMRRMRAAPVIDTTRCPLCGGDNRCAIEVEHVTGVPQPPCWCMSTPLDAASAGALRERIPDEARDAACICAACMARFIASRKA